MSETTPGADSKREQLSRLLREKVQENVVPLSEGQKALWILHQIAPQSAAYNVAFTATIKSPVDIGALSRALTGVVARHDMLRATFETRGGVPAQRIHPSIEVALEEVEAAAWARETLDERLVERNRQPFDLEKGPLVRAALFRRGPSESVLLLVVHHIVYDGLSIGVVVADLMALYAAEVKGQTADLPPLESRYIHFVRWQEDLLKSPEGEEMWAYWRDRLSGPLSAIQLPFDRARPAEPSFRGATHSFRIDESEAVRLRDLSREQGTTLYTVLLAAFGALLHRYTGQADVLIGSPTAGRSRREFERLVGYFVNPIVLRLDASGDPTFLEYLARVRDRVVEGLRHADYPFPILVKRLSPDRDASRSPLFQVDFNLMRAAQLGLAGTQAPQTGVSRLTLGGLDIETFTIPQQEGQFDLTFELVDTGGPLLANLKYATDLFDAATIERMEGHLRTLMRAALDAPQARLSHLSLLSEAERRQAISEWNPAEEWAKGPTLHERFERVVGERPDAIAAVCEGQSLTYDALNKAANRLAHRLKSLGVGTGSLVGLRTERDLNVAVGILGILKAGAGYLPLDPAYPKERVGFMLEDSTTQVVVASRSLASDLEGTARTIVVIDELEGGAESNPPPAATVDDLAYVIYTSGSTGKPKGVSITHHNVARLFEATQRWYGFDENDVWTVFHSYAFDFSVWEVWGALLYGGRLVVVPYETSRSPEAFRELLLRERVTVLNQTPAAFRQLVQADVAHPRQPFALRFVIFGGEALELQSLRPWFERHGDRSPLLVNMYGITETTVHVTYRPITMADVEAGAGSVIGVPIPDLQVYLVDAGGQLVPIGVPGEIYVGGAGVARGYLNRPELSAERFVEDSFRPGLGRRLYRSGDLAKRLPNGDLEYLGRIDHQVKIRGFRIELGEIEAAIALDPAVREVVVIAREDAPGDKRLAAYIATADAGLVERLRRRLKDDLPEYMVPSHFVTLEALPLTANGKVDKAALPVPDSTAPDAEHVAPRTPTEEILVGIWSEVLGVERVSVDADFFDLGGHSLLATQVIGRARRAFGTNVPFKDFFAAPTVARLAARIEALRRSGPAVVDVPVSTGMREGPAALSFAQQRLWFLDQMEPGSAAYVIAGAIEMAGVVDADALDRALGMVVARHDALRTTFVSVDGEPRQVVTAPDDWHLREDDTASGDVLAKMKDEASRGFDLQRGPLFRAVLYRLAAQRHVLLLAMHHIISDGWSLGVLMREVGDLYGRIASGKEATLDPLPLQYREYAAWQRAWLTGAVLDEQLAHWQTKLAGAPAQLDLPSDRARPAVESHRGATLSFAFPQGLDEAVRGVARREGATLFMVLLAAFKALLWRCTGQEDLVVGSAVANRGRGDVEDLIGVFVNTIVFRTQVQADMSFVRLLSAVRETCLDAFSHEDVPFERVVEEVRPERDASRNPVFQIMFLLQNAPMRPLDLPGLRLAPVDVDRGAAQVDLSLHVQETPEGMRGIFEYATDLFDRTTIERLAGHFLRVLAAAAEDPGRSLARLPLLTEGESQAVARWNDTQRQYPEVTVSDLVAEQARSRPESIAVEFEGRATTYAELQRRIDAIAGRLAGGGAGPGSLVAVLLERSADMVAALLGVLRAGAAYVPMDPSFPPDRLAYMLEDSGASILLTEAGLASLIPGHSARVLILDGGAVAPGSVAAQTSRGATMEDLAYVIYTSGSTGRPKGVAITHRSLVNLLWSMKSEPGLGEDDALLAVTTPSFDIAALELYLPLVVGGRIALASRDDVLDGRGLIERLDASGATTMQATPATWRLMLEAGWKGRKGLKVLCGGEALPRDLAEVLLARVREVWNVYGPTETTIWSSCCRVESGTGPVSIGRPIANTSMYVLDAHGMMAPVGVPGELHIGGVGLARGYWRRDALTAERFIERPIDGRSVRLYKTGDQAKWLVDGSIECLGRLDQQVKVRGYRIELGEIEEALRAHPAVEQAVMVAQDGGGGDKRLVAYLTHSPDQQPNVTELRAHLRTTLPAYMIPSSFVTLDSLPLTPNGKVDRKALAALDQRAPARAVAAPPKTQTEKYVARLWSEALGVESVGLQDNFFDLGGHSLLAMRVLASIEKGTGKRLHPRDIIFQNLEQLARACGDLTQAAEPEPLEPRDGLAGRLFGKLRGLVQGAKPQDADR